MYQSRKVLRKFIIGKKMLDVAFLFWESMLYQLIGNTEHINVHKNIFKHINILS